jgi:transposase, IS605 OrfB family, central region
MQFWHIKDFFKKQAKFPKYKSKRKSKPSFYVDILKIEFTSTHVKLEKISNSKRPNKQKQNWIKLAERDRVPIGYKYTNPRVIFNGLNWFLTVGVEFEQSNDLPTNKGIGVDFGIKNLATCSDGNVYKNINKSQTVKKIEKKKRRLQRNISKKYLKNKKGINYCKTSNIVKSEKQLLKVVHWLSNIRHNYLHNVSSEIVNRKPKFIVLEDLNVSGMMKNRHLAKAIQNQCFYEFNKQFQYKSNWNNIKFIEVNRFYPSSKTCSICGIINKDLKLKNRVFKCECGNILDRDYNASLNLARYGKQLIV